MAARVDMLAKIETHKSALFFKAKRRITRKIIASAIEDCTMHREGRPRASSIRVKLRVDGEDARISYSVFKIVREPPFLKGSGLEDVIHGYIAIVELKTLTGVFFSNAQEPSRHLAKAFAKLDHPVLTRLFADDDTAYEALALANMSISKHSIRSKRVEADDLRSSFSLTGAGSSVPHHLRLRSGTSVVRVASRTSRVTKRDPTAGFPDLVRFCRSIESQLTAARPANLFIDNFAEPVTLDSLPANVNPTGLLVPVGDLETAIASGELSAIEFGRTPTSKRPLTAASYVRLLRELGIPMEVRTANGVHRVHGERRHGGGFKSASCGTILFNKKTITIRGGLFASTWLTWRDGRVERLAKYLNHEKNFIVTFTDAVHAYYSDRLFRNRGVLANADGLLGILRPEATLAAATSEKGTFAAGQTAFTPGSLFHHVESTTCAAAQVVICDDLDDEWADIIAVDDSTSPPHLSFYHCKHKALSLSASDLHVIVSQALKNLGALGAPFERFQVKLTAIWARDYRNDGVQTSIKRLMRGTANDAERALRAVASAVNASRRMCLVVSFISKARLEAAVAAVRNGGQATPQIAQILWLLMSFVGTCRDAGAEPWIICQP